MRQTVTRLLSGPWVFRAALLQCAEATTDLPDSRGRALTFAVWSGPSGLLYVMAVKPCGLIFPCCVIGEVCTSMGVAQGAAFTKEYHIRVLRMTQSPAIEFSDR
jgi:hypothetical protein